MPTYDYKCKECNKVFELFLKNRDERVICPLCRIEMKRLISAPAVDPQGFMRDKL